MDDDDVVAALRRGDESTFRRVVTTYQPGLVRAARTFVRTDSVAEEVAQETWLAVIRGLDTFQERSSFKTWLFRILVNLARTRGVRESRITPFSSLVGDGGDHASSVGADRFEGDEGRWPCHWRAAPTDWGTLPEAVVTSAETRQVIEDAIASLPRNQREVITLRDVEGFSSGEVCDVLELSEGNQRVLLHRARSGVRSMLERHFEGVAAS